MQNKGYGPYATDAIRAATIDIGDVLQLANRNGEYYHTLIISGFTDTDILVCAQSDDALDRPLSTYNYASLRALHIEGAMLYFDEAALSQDILDATSLPQVPFSIQQ
jgi:hypothetical protein